MPRRPIEREFGVPIAGEILSPELWTQTGLKRLPSTGKLAWTQVFSRPGPVVLDVGCGNGRFLIGSAVWRPDHNHLGLDILPVVIRYAVRRGNQRGLTNLRFTVAHALEFLDRLTPAASIAEVHCYHPQPYPEPGESKRRLLTPHFLAAVHRCLVPGGQFFVQTDNSGYWRYLLEIVPAFFSFHDRLIPWPDSPKGRTRREIIALRRGLPVFRGWGCARTDLSELALSHLAATLPPPDFNAGRPDLDLGNL